MALGDLRRLLSPLTGLALAAALLSVSCGDDSPSGPEPAEVTIVEISPESVPPLTELGQTVSLTATVLDQDGLPVEDPEVAWSSDLPEVATVSDQGVVTATGPGTSNIRATAGGVTAVRQIRVNSRALAIQAPATLTAGSVAQLQALLRGTGDEPETVTDQVSWSAVEGGAVTPAGIAVGHLDPGTLRVAATGGALGARSDTVEIEILPRGVAGSFTEVGMGLLAADRATTDLWVRGDAAYTGTFGDMLAVWDVSDPASPVLADSVIVDAGKVNDVKVSEDGTFAAITHEGQEPGQVGVTLLDLADPLEPTVITHYTEGLPDGVHNVWLERLQGTYYLFAASDTGEMVVVDLSSLEAPTRVAAYSNTSLMHDVYVRDGLAFVSNWDDGLAILDVGNGMQGGAPGSPVEVSRLLVEGGNVHNAWYWPGGEYVFVGQEQFPNENIPAGILHVVDVSDLRAPRTVATYRLPGDPPHNFWMDEDRGILFAAWYENGLLALDVTGTLMGELEKQDRSYVVASPTGPAGRSRFWAPQLVDADLVWASDIRHGLWSFRFQVLSPPP